MVATATATAAECGMQVLLFQHVLRFMISLHVLRIWGLACLCVCVFTVKFNIALGKQLTAIKKLKTQSNSQSQVPSSKGTPNLSATATATHLHQRGAREQSKHSVEINVEFANWKRKFA